ncbi:MAG: carbonic anhydrase [Acidobacteria bacterium]|nr:carbonic anhydrase [Acidobacteriota bacterium]
MRRHAWAAVLLVLAGNIAWGQAHAAAPAHTAPAAEVLWNDLMKGNLRFISGKLRPVSIVPLRRSLTEGQHPKVIVLACSDSRVAPEILFDKNLGDLFVVRSAGNIADKIGIGSMEYAAEHLGASVLVVLGHEKCGAVAAACSTEKMPTPNLEAIVDKISPAVSQAKGHPGPDGLLETAIRENVLQSAHDVLRQSALLQDEVNEGKLTIIEAVYEMNSGKVVWLGTISQHP